MLCRVEGTPHNNLAVNITLGVKPAAILLEYAIIYAATLADVYKFVLGD
jgi:hypothetical protein